MSRLRTASWRRWSGWLAPILVALGLTGCTGTFEAGPPTLLVVAFDDGTPRVGLVKDTFRALDAAGRDLVFVPGSARVLPEPAVAIDVVDRAGTRPTAVVLSRGAGTAPATYLRGFSLAGIDPASPSAFVEDPEYTFTLANGGTGDDGLLETRLAADYCLVDAQITRTGRYLAVFEERSACGGASFRAVYVLDLEAARTGTDPLVAVFDSPAPTNAGLYVDPTGDLDARGRAAVYFVDPVEGLKAFRFDTREVVDLDIAIAPFDPSGVVDIGRVGAALILVESDAYVIVDPTTTTPTATRVDSASGLTTMVPDPLGITTSAVFLAGDQLVVHDDVSADGFAEESSAPVRTGASLEPIDRFVYLLGDERIGVFDLLTFEGSSVQVRAFSIPEIPAATALTWTRAAAVAAP